MAKDIKNTVINYSIFIYEYKHSEVSKPHRMFKGNVQGWKHPGRCAFAEQELLSHRKPKWVVQNKKHAHKNPNNSHYYHDEIEIYHKITKKNP